MTGPLLGQARRGAGLVNAPMPGSPDAAPEPPAVTPETVRELAKLELRLAIVYLEGCSNEFELARWLAWWDR